MVMECKRISPPGQSTQQVEEQDKNNFALQKYIFKLQVAGIERFLDENAPSPAIPLAFMVGNGRIHKKHPEIEAEGEMP